MRRARMLIKDNIFSFIEIKEYEEEGLIPLKSNDSNNENEELYIWCCTHLEILHPKRLDFHEELAPGIVGDFIIEPKLILYHGRR